MTPPKKTPDTTREIFKNDKTMGSKSYSRNLQDVNKPKKNLQIINILAFFHTQKSHQLSKHRGKGHENATQQTHLLQNNEDSQTFRFFVKSQRPTSIFPKNWKDKTRPVKTGSLMSYSTLLTRLGSCSNGVAAGNLTDLV